MNHQMPLKISIITPSFNQGQYLEETILSVINQNYPNLEYIIIDGGSTDNSVDIIKKYGQHITYWVSEKDNGQSNALNKGFAVATGDIVAWLNSDDQYCEKTLIKISNTFKNNPEIDIVYGDVLNYSSIKQEVYKNKEFDLYDFFSRVSIHQPSVFWKKNILLTTGNLDESLHYCMDYDLWMRLFLDYKSLKIEETLSKFRIHNNSKTNNNPIELYNEYQIILCRFFNSQINNEWKVKLINLGIYFNTSDKKYKLKREFSNIELQKIGYIYLNNAINLEYVRNNRATFNAIIFKNPRLIFNLKNIVTIAKNFFNYKVSLNDAK